MLFGSSESYGQVLKPCWKSFYLKYSFSKSSRSISSSHTKLLVDLLWHAIIAQLRLEYYVWCVGDGFICTVFTRTVRYLLTFINYYRYYFGIRCRRSDKLLVRSSLTNWIFWFSYSFHSVRLPLFYFSFVVLPVQIRFTRSVNALLIKSPSVFLFTTRKIFIEKKKNDDYNNNSIRYSFTDAGPPVE